MEVNEKKLKETANQLGRAIGQTDAARALERAREAMRDEEETWELFQEVQQLQQSLLQKMQQGRDVSEERRDDLQEKMQELEGKRDYQQFVSAQMNFDKLMETVNDQIQEGIQEGEDSNIIEL